MYRWGEVDRVVDYATAQEAAVVPETDLSKYRCATFGCSSLASVATAGLTTWIAPYPTDLARG